MRTDEFPIAWRDTEEGSVLCPYCKCMHRHGKGDGHRVAHCTKKVSAFGYLGNSRGYIVKTKESNATPPR